MARNRHTIPRHPDLDRIPAATRGGQDYCGVRLGIELRARAIDAANQMGIPLSEWLRMAVSSALDYGLNGIHQGDPQALGYMHGRALGIAIAQQQLADMMSQLAESLPITVEEATARGLLPPSMNGY